LPFVVFGKLCDCLSLSLRFRLQANGIGNSMGLILEARRPQNLFGSVAYGKVVITTCGYRSSVKRARLSQYDVQMMITTINRVKHLGAVLNELVAVDDND
jgi:hypothetical protein